MDEFAVVNEEWLLKIIFMRSWKFSSMNLVKTLT